MMGSGKSSVGRHLAETANLGFIDLDDFIEKKEGRSISDIFRDGENYFREVEAVCLVEILMMKKADVLSLGGGALNVEKNVTLIKREAVLVYLDVPISELARRLEGSSDRPLLQTEGQSLKSRLETLYAQRKGQYAQANFRVNGNQPPAAVADEILGLMRD